MTAPTLNAATLARRLDIPERTINQKLDKAGYKVLNGSPIPNKWVAFVCQEYSKKRVNRSTKTNAAAKDILKHISAGDIGAAVIAPAKTDQPEKWTLRQVFAILPLPLTGLVAAYGVWSLSGYFVPWWMQAIEAVAIESVYISLAAITIKDEAQQKLATRVSRGALIVSVVYGSLAACFHIVPDLFDKIELVGKIALAVLHGAPFPLIAFSIANLFLHQRK